MFTIMSFLAAFCASRAGPIDTGGRASPKGTTRLPPVCELRLEPYAIDFIGSRPEAVAVGDVNGDARNDVLVTTSFDADEANDFKLFVFLQEPAGALAMPVKYPTPGTARPESVAVGDVTGDGANDVVIGKTGSGVGVFVQNLEGGLDPVVMYSTSDSFLVRIADLNGDGRNDVVGLGAGTNTVSILFQQTSGRLGAPVVYSVPGLVGSDLEVGDINQDGRADIVVMGGYFVSFFVLYQLVDGSLGDLVSRSLTPPQWSNGVGVGDVNGDGRQDVVISHGGNWPSSAISRFLQDSGGTLGQQSTQLAFDVPEAIEARDLDGNGFDDVVVLHGGWRHLGVHLQEPVGELSAERLFPIPYATHYLGHSLAVGDFTGDGLSDVAIADYNWGLVTLRQRPGLSRPCAAP